MACSSSMRLKSKYLFVLISFICLSVFTRAEEKPVAAKSAEMNPHAPKSEDVPWLDIGIQHRIRYETLDNRFRVGETGSDQQLPQRTRFRLEIKRIFAPLGFVMEFEDSRIHLDDSGSIVNNTMVNENDILQLYLNFAMKPLGKSKLPSTFYVGRQTLDLGSRRLVARNSFRNTTNAFDAIRWTLGDEKHWQLATFLSRPVRRRMHQPDVPDAAGAFWGAFLSAQFAPQFKNEFYYFGLRESMTASKSSKRQYSTVGTRLFNPAKKGELSYEFEAALQFGKKSARDQLAHFEHIAADYTFNSSWQPKLTGRYDYASGTKDSSSQESGCFDTLYGARRFDFGPTGIYGAFARSNLSSPGLGVEMKPSKKLTLASSMRWFWLASARDQWAGTSLKDASGNSGSYLGSQVELRLTYNAHKYFKPEVGYTRLFKGSYAERVPGSPGSEDANYFYVQADFVFDHLLKRQ